MQLLLDDDLVEAIITLGISGRMGPLPAPEVRRFHAERERCYGVADPGERGAAFARVHADWFTAWGFRERLDEPVGRFPELESRLMALVFRRSRGRQDEGAELYLDAAGRRRGVVALRPDRVASVPALTGFLHHELAHLADMVNEDFKYSPDLGRACRNPSQERVVRERYRLLWSVSVDGRLAHRGLEGLHGVDRRRSEVESAFGYLSSDRRMALFDALWEGALASHGELLELACDPRGLEGRHEPVPGAACPLCGFAAFRWSDARALRPAARERIEIEFPAWQTHEPICARCAEIYDAIVGLEYPATVCL